MEALVGEVGRVVSLGRDLPGTVRLQGSLWNATAPEPLTDGDEVEVVGWSRHDRPGRPPGPPGHLRGER